MDITFGGMFLGVWLVEAKRSLASPLIIEGSSWAKGRLTFFSTTDPRRLNYDKGCFGQQPEFNGVIELEFKPEVLMLKLVVKHVWKDPQRRREIFMPDFKTATVGDLKQEISKKYSPGVSCLIMSGKVLEEDKSMRYMLFFALGEIYGVDTGRYTKVDLPHVKVNQIKSQLGH